MGSNGWKRREFLGTAGLGAAAAAASPAAVGRAGRGANDTIRVGVLGPGGRGTQDMNDCMQWGTQYNARVTAVCDIWSQRRDAAAARVKSVYGTEPKVYRRMEDLLADRDVDAVIIGTADHQHGQMLKATVEAGKDAYCEKPMANVMEEAVAALDAVKRTGKIVQIGTQRRSWPHYRMALRKMKQGMIGDIVHVQIIQNEHGNYNWAKKESDLAQCRESDLDWKAFLLGKPDRPFDPRIYRSFRLFKDFSSGIIDQWVSHMIDAVHMLTGESYPRSAVAHGGIYWYHDYRENPDSLQVVFEYGEGAKKFLCTYGVCLANGTGKTFAILGTRGSLEVEYVWRWSGEGIKSQDRIYNDEAWDPALTQHHMANWLDAVRKQDGAGLYCNADAGYGHSVACILATDAYWSGCRKTFDPVRKSIQTG
jgi:predicted dehydrogenase